MYKIGEAARLMGVSTEALRYYERKGLVVPRKDLDSNYRYYDASQINHLLNMQRYQKFGFSLYEMVEMSYHSDGESFEALMKKKEEELVDKSMAINMQLYCMNQSLRHMQMAKDAKGKIVFGERPAMYRLSYMVNDHILNTPALEEERKRWAGCNDLQFISALMHQEDFEKQVDFHEYGFAMYKDIAEFIGVKENEVITLYEECPALVCSFESSSDTSVFDYMEIVKNFLQEHELMISGDLLTQVLYSHCEDQHFRMQHLLWIPYRKKDN